MVAATACRLFLRPKPASSLVASSSAPDGIGAISDEEVRKLREGRKAKRLRKRDMQKETQKAASFSSDADIVAVDATLKSTSDHVRQL